LEIANYAKRNGLVIDEWLEVEISSRKDIRLRRIEELLGKLRRQDILIVSEVSRLARSMREVHNIMHELMAKKVMTHIIKQNITAKGDSDMTTKIPVNSFAMAAELERELISQRTKNGLARVKAEGKKLGNPRIELINAARRSQADAFAERLRLTLEAYLRSGMTQRQIVQELNALGIKTQQGRQRTLCGVQRVLWRIKPTEY
jgi:DNA invertase Pin-like site-specific DNA recombinase